MSEADPNRDETSSFPVGETTPNPVALVVGDGVLETVPLDRTLLTDRFGEVFTSEAIGFGLSGRRRKENRRVGTSTRAVFGPTQIWMTGWRAADGG
jgi:hypothetical protein